MAERGADGKFLPGNAGGPGNPFAARVAELRGAVLAAVTPEDLQAIVRALVEAALGGDVAAAKVLFDRALGRPLERAELRIERERRPSSLPQMTAEQHERFTARLVRMLDEEEDGEPGSETRADEGA